MVQKKYTLNRLQKFSVVSGWLSAQALYNLAVRAKEASRGRWGLIGEVLEKD